MENNEKRTTLDGFIYYQMYIFYTAQFTRHKLRLLSSYRNTIINQSARVFSLSYFKSLYSLAFGCGLWGKAKGGPLKKKNSFMNYFTLYFSLRP